MFTVGINDLKLEKRSFDFFFSKDNTTLESEVQDLGVGFDRTHILKLIPSD